MKHLLVPSRWNRSSGRRFCIRRCFCSVCTIRSTLVKQGRCAQQRSHSSDRQGMLSQSVPLLGSGSARGPRRKQQRSQRRRPQREHKRSSAQQSVAAMDMEGAAGELGGGARSGFNPMCVQQQQAPLSNKISKQANRQSSWRNYSVEPMVVYRPRNEYVGTSFCGSALALRIRRPFRCLRVCR